MLTRKPRLWPGLFVCSAMLFVEGFGVPHSPQFSFVPIPCPLGLDLHAASFAGGVVVEAAPWPVLGLLDETSCDRVSMHVAQLLNVLLVSQDIEVVVPGLPELSSFTFESLSSRL